MTRGVLRSFEERAARGVVGWLAPGFVGRILAPTVPLIPALTSLTAASTSDREANVENDQGAVIAVVWFGHGGWACDGYAMSAFIDRGCPWVRS